MHLYENLADEFAELIATGRLRPGDRLPSVRQLARQRHLSASTIVQALHALEGRGIVEARPQSGFYVRRRGAVLTDPTEVRASTPVDVGVSRRVVQVLRSNEAPGMVPLGSALPAPELLLSARINRMYGSIARQYPHLLAGTSHAELGESSLTDAVVRRSLEWGYPITPEELVITNSCTEAMMLCLRAVTQPGDTVAVESPTYYLMLQLLECMGLKALEIPTHPEHGVSVEALELATRSGQVAACLFVPNGANPLGCVMPDDAKRRVVALLSSRSIPLIEDDIYGDICFTRDRPRPFHAFDTTGNTLMCTSWSKSASPALRVGFVAAGKRVRDIMELKTITSGKTNPLTQRVLAELIDARGFDRHLTTLRRRFAEQIGRMQDAVSRYFPAGTRVTDPKGGLVLWVELPEEIDASALHRVALTQRIAFVPGEMFSPSGRYRNHLRLACGHPWRPEIADAIKRLAGMMGAVGAV